MVSAILMLEVKKIMSPQTETSSHSKVPVYNGPSMDDLLSVCAL